LYQHALALLEQIASSENATFATILTNLAELYYRMNRLKKAEPLFRRALKIYEKIFGSYHPKVADTLDRLGSLLLELYRYQEVEPFFQRALSIYENNYGTEDSAVTKVLCNLANLYTSNMRGYLPLTYKTKYKEDMTKFVIDEIIKEYLNELDISELKSLVNKKDLSNEEKAHISIIGVNLKIINYGSQNFNIELKQVPYYYQGHKEGAKMVSMVYECHKIGTRVRTNGNYTQKRTQNLKNAVLKTLETNFLSKL